MLVKFLVGTIVGGIVMYVLGFLIYGLLLDAYMKASVHQYPGLMKDPPEMISLFLFNVAWAAVLAVVFVKYAGIKDFVSGLTAGVIIFFFITLGIDLSFVAFMNLYNGVAPVIVDVLMSTIIGGITGGVIGFVFGKLDKSET